jgi:hypothetical protein
MRSVTWMSRLRSGCSVRAFAFAACVSLSAPAPAQTSFLQNGSGGFVVSDIKYALAEDAAKTGACPKGMSLNTSEIFALTPQGKRKMGESDVAYAHRLNEGAT